MLNMMKYSAPTAIAVKPDFLTPIFRAFFNCLPYLETDEREGGRYNKIRMKGGDKRKVRMGDSEGRRGRNVRTYLSASLFSPPNATTVLMAERTSSATAPAAA